MRKAGVVSTDVKGEDNEFYHDIISLFKIYQICQLENAD